MVTGCILLGGYAAFIQPDVVTSVLICAATLTAAITGYYRLPYYRAEPFGGKSPRKVPAGESRTERSLGDSVKTMEDTRLMPVCSTSDDRLNNDLESEPMLDAALDRIIRGLDRDLEIRR